MQRVLMGFLVIGLTWLVGLAVFITSLPAPAATKPTTNDAVVVYTGGGGARISAGMSIFADGAAKRMLISGVNKKTTRANIADLWIGEADLFECCVDLGFEARSTIGNAGEAARWAADHDVERIILVTSEYHMPRAMAESRTRMPDAVITPYAVASGFLDAEGRPQSRDAWLKLAGEYNKYLVAKVKTVIAAIRG